ncbi:MAG: arginine--tRNA ligase [Trueperaceae bacterium]|nr:arginine--tRNA ligase [Trueperaceae bacterium]
MQDLKQSLQSALDQALKKLEVSDVEIPIQEVPDNKPGDYGSPVAFGLAKVLRKNPAAIAQEILQGLELPAGIAKAEAVGPYINFFVDNAAFIKAVIDSSLELPQQEKKYIVEHTSINPNKEAHVGHLRNIALGDAIARILKAAGYTVEIQNYIDDTGRQAAESLFAVSYFKLKYDGSKKYDHWLGELYVNLQKAKETDAETIEAGVREVMHQLEQGKLRKEIAEIVYALLQTSYDLGVEYDLLVWESDVVASGFLAQGLAILENSDYVNQPAEGKYAGALIMDVSEFIPGLEEPNIVLVRSDGNAMYVAKDIGYHYWKAGMFEGLKFEKFDTQPSGRALYSSSPSGELHPDGKTFAHADDVVNVIDARQSHPQTIVKAALRLSDHNRGHDLYHLAYEVVTLEGQAMSGRKGITLAIDDVIAEAKHRAKAVISEKNPDLDHVENVARQVGVGALRFGMLKSESKRIIDFRWDQALSLQGDSAPYVQYAHARASKILRDAAEQKIDLAEADFAKTGELEAKVAQMIAKLPDVISLAARDYAPHVVAQYALDLAATWNWYYNHKDEQGRPDTRIFQSDDGLKEARLMLVGKLKETLAKSLELLGIEAPEEM